MPSPRRRRLAVACALGVAVVQGVPATSRGRASLSRPQGTFCHTAQTEGDCPGYAKVMRWCCGQSDGRDGRNETCDAYMGKQDLCGGKSNMQQVMASCCDFEWGCTGGWCGAEDENGEHQHIGTASASDSFAYSPPPEKTATAKPLPVVRRWGNRAPIVDPVKPQEVMQQTKVAQADDGIEVIRPDASEGPALPTMSSKREYHKRPPGRAPNGENGAPMQWDSDLGGWVPTSADDPRVKSSAAKEAVRKDAAMAAAAAVSAAAAARREASDKPPPIVREEETNGAGIEVVTDGIEVVRHEEMDGHNDAGHQQPEWAAVPHQSSVQKQPKGPVPNGENGAPMQWDANDGKYVQGPNRMKQRVNTPDVASQASAVQGEAVQGEAAQSEHAETWQQAQRRARKEAREKAGGITTDANGVVIGPDWGEPEATIVTDGVDDGIMSGNAAAAAAAIAAAPKFDMDEKNDPSKFDIDDDRKRGADPNVATEECVSLQASVNDYWCSTVCSNGACPKHLCKCGAQAEEASATKAANAAAASSADAAAAMQAPNSAATPSLQCVNVSPVVTVDWCVSTCSHGRCPPRFCKCGADALEAEAESAAAAAAPAATAAPAPALPIVRERVAVPPKAAKEMECTPKSITVTADWCKTSCSAGGNCPKALCACVSADSGEIAFPAPSKEHRTRSRATELRRETGHPNRR
jgi:hypothetical protein